MIRQRNRLVITAMTATMMLASQSQATMYWLPARTGSGTSVDPYLMTGNWWDGTTGSDPGSSSNWATSWPGFTPPPPVGTLPWTQGETVNFPNKGGSNTYEATLTIYGNVQVAELIVDGASTKATINAAGPGDSLTLAADGLFTQTTTTINAPIVLGAPEVEMWGYNAAIHGVISDGGNGYGIRKTAGSWFHNTDIYGVNTYTGATKIESGRLRLMSGASIANSSGVNLMLASADPVLANRTGAFDSSAVAGANIKSLTGNGVVDASGSSGGLVVTQQLAPGTSSGTGTIAFGSGLLTVGNGATYDFLIDGNTSTVDLVDLSNNSSSTVVFAGSWTLNLDALGAVDPTGQTYVLFELGNSNAVNLGSYTIDHGTTDWVGGTIQQSGSQILLTGVTPIPEPASLVLLGAGGLVMLRRRNH